MGSRRETLSRRPKPPAVSQICQVPRVAGLLTIVLQNGNDKPAGLTSTAGALPLGELDLDVNTGGQIELHQRVDGLRVGCTMSSMRL